MIDHGRKSVLGIKIDAVDYDAAVVRIIASAEARRPMAVSALAVHGVMTGVLNDSHACRLNGLDLVVPDGQPVRWALNLLYGTALRDRVYGPRLTLRLCEEAARKGLPIYFYGSTEIVVALLADRLCRRFPGLQIAGCSASRFRSLTLPERSELAQTIRNSGARLLFVGLGCPRQEVFAYEMRALLDLPVVSVGAAFDYHSGAMKEPPEFVQRWGLQWLYRFAQEPRRLWRRYGLLNPLFAALLCMQKLRLWKPKPGSGIPPKADLMPG